MTSRCLEFIKVVALLVFASPADILGGPSAESQVEAIAKQLKLDLGFDQRTSRLTLIVGYEDHPSVRGGDPHLGAVLNALEHFSIFSEMSKRSDSPRDGVQKSANKREWRTELVLPGVGRFVNNSNYVEATGSFDSFTEVVTGTGARKVIKRLTSDSLVYTVDPHLRGDIVRAFYQMGFRELAYRRSNEKFIDRDGEFVTHAWLFCIDLPREAAPRKR
jgi:hypothetical protein